MSYAAITGAPGALSVRPHAGEIRMNTAHGLFELQAGKRLLLAILAAGLFAMLACTAFYLFEVDRLASNQLAALAHQLGQAIRAGDPELDDDAKHRPTQPGQHFVWQLEKAQGALTRQIQQPASTGQKSRAA